MTTHPSCRHCSNAFGNHYWKHIAYAWGNTWKNRALCPDHSGHTYEPDVLCKCGKWEREHTQTSGYMCPGFIEGVTGSVATTHPTYFTPATVPEPREEDQTKKCSGCDGRGEVGGWAGTLASGGYENECCPFCHGTGIESNPESAGDINDAKINHTEIAFGDYTKGCRCMMSSTPCCPIHNATEAVGPQTVSDTPRTDYEYKISHAKIPQRFLEHTYTLERELTTALARLEAVEKYCNEYALDPGFHHYFRQVANEVLSIIKPKETTNELI